MVGFERWTRRNRHEAISRPLEEWRATKHWASRSNQTERFFHNAPKDYFGIERHRDPRPGAIDRKKFAGSYQNLLRGNGVATTGDRNKRAIRPWRASKARGTCLANCIRHIPHPERANVYWTEDSLAMKEPLALALKTAASPFTPILVEAEPGLGAATVAALVHAHTATASSHRLVSVHCTGAPESAIAAELFADSTRGGSKPSDETMNSRKRGGAVERARGGTLFIDEIALLGPETQAALAVLLDSHRHHARRGFRLVAASSTDLQQQVERRKFRQQLLEQIGTIRITIPPLRERPSELITMAEWFLSAAAKRLGITTPTLSAEAQDKLSGHSFPGNVDELRAVIDRALIVDRSEVLSADAIRFDRNFVHGGSGSAFAFVKQQVSQTLEEHKRPPTLNEIERDYIIWLLRDAAGNRTVVARQMGVSYPTVMKKISDYKIDLQEFFRQRPSANRRLPKIP